MKMTGEEIIAAPRQLVWDALNDPEVLKKCITGCEEIKKKSDTEFDARMTAKVGPVKASFTGNVKLSKLNPPRSYVISGEGKGGVAGFAKGGATVRLSDTGENSTKLAYDVDAQVGGKLAQIGSRLIDSTARKMAADFFNKFNKTVSQMAESDDMAKKPTAKKAAAKKPAAKKTATKKSTAKTPVASKASAKTTASKAATKKATSKTTAASKPASKAATKAKSTTKAAATKAASKTTAARKTASKTVTKASKSASKTTKTVSKSASKTAAKTSKAANTAGAAAKKSASSAATSVADKASKVTASASSAASKASAQVQSTASSAASSASTMANKTADTASNNIPPEVKSMSGMWIWIMLAAAAGLVIVWAMGK